MFARASTRTRGATRLLADLAHEARLLPGRRLTSIFFGGGTPSLMDAGDRRGDHRRRATAIGMPPTIIEITLEANPNSVEAARFADLAAAGVNRLSLGLQSFDDEALALPRPRALGARGLARAGDRAERFRPRQLRPDLRASRRHRGALVGDAWPGAVARHHAPVALPADDRARHALRRAWPPAASSSRSTPTTPRRSTS